MHRVGSISTSKMGGPVGRGGATNRQHLRGPATGNPGLGLNASLGNSPTKSSVGRSREHADGLAVDQRARCQQQPERDFRRPDRNDHDRHDATVNMETGRDQYADGSRHAVELDDLSDDALTPLR